MTMAGPTSHSFTSQRLRLHYADWGNAGAPPLLLLHGGRDHCRSWDWTAQQLRRDWHVIAPDWRGHGDSAWSPDGEYGSMAYVYDLAQLVHQQGLAPVTIVAHSMGGSIALRYAGLYPDNVRKLVAIEGLGPSPAMLAKRQAEDFAARQRGWIEAKRAAAARLPRRYANIDEALARMKSENSFLSDEQARHLTIHGVNHNEDGTCSWKFDNYLHLPWISDTPQDQMEALWQRITCPTLLLYGEKSWASNPQADGRAVHFANAEVVTFPDAGHWLHHDRFDLFMATIVRFLSDALAAA
ncbi:alpha/beta hydrolase [Sandarakinorhabdus sp.]|uniref:alpha/beta fold hydrolase n=1 Tax=Sandarakinorhabdus sp. TaxID=1916663 RepID=UPI00286E9367|nr:alpha/beta hydrolase [Sandarakinorhabdus sp.]